MTVKFARQESERAKKAREKSFSYLSKQSAKQLWHRVDYYDTKSSRAEVSDILFQVDALQSSSKVSTRGLSDGEINLA